MDKLQPILLAAGVILLFGMILASRAFRRTGGGLKERQADLNEIRRRQDARDNLEHLAVELQELSRENLAKLETRIRMLQALIAEADARIAKLQGAPTKSPAPPVQQKVFELSDRGASVDDIGRQTGLERGEVELILGLRGLPEQKKA